MEKQEISHTVTLKDLWGVFTRNLIIIILVGAAVTGGTFMGNRLTTEPQYKSTATLYILRQDNETTTTSDFTLALNVVNDCTYFLKSHSVVDQVIEELGLSMSYGQLRKCISTSNPESTRILEVTVIADSPQQAKDIVDRVCEIGAEKIEKAMGFSQVRLYEYGIFNDTPSNSARFVYFLAMGIVAAALTYAVCLVIFLQDDRIRTDEDVERYLGLCVLGNIPKADETGKNKSLYGIYGHGQSKKVEEPGADKQPTTGEKGM